MQLLGELDVRAGGPGQCAVPGAAASQRSWSGVGVEVVDCDEVLQLPGLKGVAVAWGRGP